MPHLTSFLFSIRIVNLYVAELLFFFFLLHRLSWLYERFFADLYGFLCQCGR